MEIRREIVAITKRRNPIPNEHVRKHFFNIYIETAVRNMFEYIVTFTLMEYVLEIVRSPI